MTETREALASLVRWIYSRGWAPGTGGNYSAKISDSPLRLLMTPSGVDKGTVQAGDLLIVDENAQPIEGKGKPSAEALIHVAVYNQRDAAVIVHTHSVANTVLSLSKEELQISGFEMLKALEGIKTHEHTEIVPILDNAQEMAGFSAKVEELLKQKPDIHAFLMRGHGLYTWGSSFFEAKRHLETLEFLFEIEAALRLRP